MKIETLLGLKVGDIIEIGFGGNSKVKGKVTFSHKVSGIPELKEIISEFSRYATSDDYVVSVDSEVGVFNLFESALKKGKYTITLSRKCITINKAYTYLYEYNKMHQIMNRDLFDKVLLHPDDFSNMVHQLSETTGIKESPGLTWFEFHGIEYYNGLIHAPGIEIKPGQGRIIMSTNDWSL